ncbi:MAG: helix-turn-helix domain-containing protein [Deltaproteobacteria bacterium]|nr:helix-turn-helix domain-containing protein [Deltaproteobacteria bacterium]
MATLLSVPVTTVQWWRLSGKLRFVRVGRYPRVLKADLERFLDERASDNDEVGDGDPS